MALWGSLRFLPQDGIGLINPRDDPAIYPLTVLLLLASLAVTSVALLRAERSAAALARTAGLGALYVVLIYGFWLGLRPSHEQLLSFSSPPQGVPWLIFSARDTLQVVAIVAHIFLAAGTAIGLLFVTDLLLPDLSSAATDALLSALFIVFVIALELGDWPAWIVVPAEFAFVHVLAGNIATAVSLVAQKLSLANPAMRRRVIRARVALAYALQAAGLAIVAFFHSTDLFVLNALAIYWIFVSGDDIVACLIAIRHPVLDNYRVVSPRRWVVTIPATLVLAVLAARNVLGASSWNPNIGGQVWIEAAVGASAVMLFRPVTDLARYSAGIRDTKPGPDDYARDLSQAARALAQYALQLIPAPSGTPAASGQQPGGDRPPKRVATVLGDRYADLVSKLPPDEHPRPTADTQRRETFRILERLRFPAAVFFFAALLAYQLIETNSAVGPLLGERLVPLVVGLTGLVTGLVTILDKRALEATRDVMLLLLFLIVVLTGVTLLLTILSPSATNIFALDAPPLTELPTTQFLLVAARGVAQELLIMITVGEIGYLFVAIDTTLRLARSEMQDVEDEDWYNLAGSRFARRQYESALKALDRAVALSPNRAAYRVAQAIVYERLGRREEALASYDRALQLGLPDGSYTAVEVWRWIGDLFYDQERFQEASDAYRQAADDDPASVGALSDLAYALNHLECFDEALQMVERALNIDPNNADTWVAKGQFLSDLERDREAIEAYNRALALKRDHLAALEGKADALNNLGRHSDALALFNRSLKRDRTRSAAWAGKSYTLTRLKRFKEALASSERAVSLSGTKSAYAWDTKSDALNGLQRYSEGLHAAETSIGLRVPASATWRCKGDALRGLERYDEAVMAYERAIELKETNVLAWQGKAQALLPLGRQAEAEIAAQRAAELASALETE